MGRLSPNDIICILKTTVLDHLDKFNIKQLNTVSERIGNPPHTHARSEEKVGREAGTSVIW